MHRLIVVLAVPHQLQGPKFRGFVRDPSYPVLLRDLGLIHGIDFIFEEAAGRRPSIAEKCAESEYGSGHYADVDPPVKERPKLGIAEETELPFPIEGTVDTYSELLLDEHRKREEFWVSQILEQDFNKALMVCGIGHGLSLSRRLAEAKVCDVRLLNYAPFSKLCSHAER